MPENDNDALAAQERRVSTIYRDGSFLVVPYGAVLPDRCVLTNKPADGVRLQWTASWMSPVYSIIYTFGIFLWPMATFFQWPRQELWIIPFLLSCLLVSRVRQLTKIDLGICRNAKRRWQAPWWLLAAYLIAVIAYSILCVTKGFRFDGQFVLFVGVFVVTVMFVYNYYTILSVRRMDGRMVWLKGVCPAYLENLPRWTTSAQPEISPEPG